jgi:methionine-rich copper-binding protein CopC
MTIMKAIVLSTALVWLATPAFAHAHLKSADPADTAVLDSSPASISLSFTEGLELAFSGIVLTGPSGPVTLGAAGLAGDDHARLVIPVPAPLAAGTYTVNWHALSTDGHKTIGRTVFTVK